MSNIEILPNFARARGKDCLGCERYNASVMMTFTDKDPWGKVRFFDMFLSQKQAEELYEELGRVLERNNETST